MNQQARSVETAETSAGPEGEAGRIALCVDLDGTLIRSDLLVESLFALLGRQPVTGLRLPFWLAAGKARFKHRIAARTDLDIAALPYNEDVVEFVRAERAKGRRIVLATASHEKFATAVARHLDLFDAVVATGDGGANLAGEAKLDRILAELDGQPFDYIGNARADLAIWAAAHRAILVEPSAGLARAARRVATVAKVFPRPRDRAGAYFKALRPHQWAKNLLMFLPLAMGHKLGEPTLVWQAALGFVAFSLCASSVYLLNDLIDLESDRRHPRKRFRPFAAGRVPLTHGLALIPVLLLASLAVALVLPFPFLPVLGFYYVCTLAYSLKLKRISSLDVLVLAGLYTLRIIAGAAAVLVMPSFWLLAFSMFFFLSLAMVKRYAELLSVRDQGGSAAAGRNYQSVDMETLAQLGSGSGYCAVLVLALYVNSDQVRLVYGRPEVIWLFCPLLLYWITRVWLGTRRGKMHDDPVVFAIRDRVSLMLGAIGAVIWIAAL